MRNNIELLSPAGDWDAFQAAVENGADAVYLGGQLFNARQYAGNFDDIKLKAAIDYAHIRGVKVYLTMNTLLSDREMSEAFEFAQKAYVMGIDAVIVQDIGFASLIRKYLPDMDIHASTQMTIYNLDGVKLLQKMGFKRIVLARELSIEEIREITQNTSLEIEMFVHGALCISYSGQCLMSSMIGGRSGNRGKCAQPCRLPYELCVKNLKNQEEGIESCSLRKGYLMSPKDICLVNDLPSIVESGVKSLKIEGRMKSPEYVATVVRIYRKYLDEVISGKQKAKTKEVKAEEKDINELLQIFNRGGFSKGYFFSKTGKDMICIEKPKNWGTYLGEVISFDKKSGRVRMSLQNDLSIGDGIEIWNNDDESPGNIITEILCKGKSVDNVKKGSVADVGSLKGNIFKGNAVYKTSDKGLNLIARESFREGNVKKIDLSGEINLERNKPVVFIVKDDRGNKIIVENDYVPEEAVFKEITEERLLQQLNKTGSTPYRFKEINVKLDKNISIPVGRINEIRRQALDEISNRRIEEYERILPEIPVKNQDCLSYFLGNSEDKIEIKKKTEKNLKTSVLFRSTDISVDFSVLNVERVYIPFRYFIGKDSEKTIRQCRNKGVEVFAWLPSVTRGNYDRLIKEKIESLIMQGLEGILAGNPGTLEYLNRYSGLKLSGEFSLNIFNSCSINEMKNLGLKSVTLSPELTLNQIGDFKVSSQISVEAIVYGRIPMMTSEYCPVGSFEGNFGTYSKCLKACRNGKYSLKDRKGKEFPVLCDSIDCRSVILNSDIHLLIESMDKIRNSGLDFARIDITDENTSEIYEILEMYRNITARGVEALGEYSQLVERLKSRGFTKGHYFRGV